MRGQERKISAGERKTDRGEYSVICLVWIVLQRKCTRGAQRNTINYPLLLIHNPGLSSQIHTSRGESRLHFAHMHSHMETRMTKHTHSHRHTKPNAINPLCDWELIQMGLCLCASRCLMFWYEACSNQSPMYSNMIITLSSVNVPLRAVTVRKSWHYGKGNTCFLDKKKKKHLFETSDFALQIFDNILPPFVHCVLGMHFMNIIIQSKCKMWTEPKCCIPANMPAPQRHSDMIYSRHGTYTYNSTLHLLQISPVIIKHPPTVPTAKSKLQPSRSLSHQCFIITSESQSFSEEEIPDDLWQTWGPQQQH